MNEEKENTVYVNENSVKSIYVDICYEDLTIASATGFIVYKDKTFYLITNRHVVTGRNNETNECLDLKYGAIPNKIIIMVPRIEGKKWIWSKVVIQLYNVNGEPIWLEHPTYKNRVDVVAIKLCNDIQTNFYYNLKSNYYTSVTDNVFIVGYPFGFNVNPKNGKYAIWTTGIIASDPDLNLNINDEQLPAFLIDAKTRHGQSGSPVIYYSSIGIDKTNNGIGFYGFPIIHEIGIYSGRINKESDLGYVWKWSLIGEIINQ